MDAGAEIVYHVVDHGTEIGLFDQEVGVHHDVTVARVFGAPSHPMPTLFKLPCESVEGVNSGA